MKIAQMGLVLSVWFSVAGSSDVVGLVGSSVELDIQRPVPEFRRLSWMFNRTIFVLEFSNKVVPFSRYKDRVEFNERTYSLTLKNLQKTDSGLYEARASDEEDTLVAEYRLSVLDPVEDPVLTQPNNDTCNITLTCRGHDLSINSTCYKKTCEKKEVTSPGGVTLSLSVRGSSIICNHSNPASWKNKTLKMGELKRSCADEYEETPSPPDWLWIFFGILGVIVLIVIILFICFKIRQTKKSAGVDITHSENTLYAVVQATGAATPPIALETPTTVYSTVQTPQPTSNGELSETAPDAENEQQPTSEPNSANTYDTVPNQSQSMKPETVYATVAKPSKPVTQDTSDGTA